MMETKKVSIIGTGALGSTLARALAENDFPIAGLFNRSQDKLQRLKKDIQPKTAGQFPASLAGIGDICFITVPDSNIRIVADQLAKLSDGFSELIMVHCSGSKTSKELQALREKGASVSSFHPLQTFTDSSNSSDFSGIYFDVEGDREAVSYLKDMAQMLGSQCMEIDSEAKPYLHAAAVMSSNYLVALLERAATIAEMGGLNKTEARRALLPLMEKTLQNSARSKNLPDVLSGPVARGDVETVKDHIKLLEQKPQVLALYRQLGMVALELADSTGDISEAQYEKLTELLES